MSEREVDFPEISVENFSLVNDKLPVIHSKWLRYYYTEKIKLSEMKKNIDSLKKKTYEYYKTQYALEVKQSHMEFYINSDDKFSEERLKYLGQEEVVSFLREVIDSIKTLGFIIKNHIEWQKFKFGV